MIAVRSERRGDEPAIRAVHEGAFGRPEEAALVDALRAAGAHVVSLVVEDEGVVVGHVLFSPVSVEVGNGGLGLGPIGICPDRQGSGLGALLVRHGLAECRARGHEFVVVLGEPGFYRRFGFVPAAAHALRCEYDALDDAFMVVELTPGALASRHGLVRYRPEFAGS